MTVAVRSQHQGVLTYRMVDLISSERCEEEVRELLTRDIPFEEIEQTYEEVNPAFQNPRLLSDELRARVWGLSEERIGFLDVGRAIDLKDLILLGHEYGAFIALARLLKAWRDVQDIERPVFAPLASIRIQHKGKKERYTPYVVFSKRIPVPRVLFHHIGDQFPEDALFLVRYSGL